jgi:ParB family transcriptional regulator, chromosome partitioning protein
MATINASEQARANRLASMTRGASPRNTEDPESRAFEGRSRLKGGAVIRCDRIVPDPDQPRQDFDAEALEQLAGSLRARGQLQPIRVRWSAESDAYVIVTGERRWRAAAIAGIEMLECVVVDRPASAADLLEDQLVENCLRSDLRPIELARSYQTLMEARGLSQRALADRLNVSPASVAKAVALLTLPDAIQESVDAGAIGPDVGYQLSKIEDAGEQAELAERAVAGSIRRDEIQARTRIAASPRRSRAGAGLRPWRYDHRDLVRVAVTAMSDEATEDDVIESLKAALAAYRKANASRRSSEVDAA